MLKHKYEGFFPIDKKEEMCTFGSGVGAVLTSISSGVSIANEIFDGVFDSIIKSKIINKIDDVEKGEIELNKNGVRLKWDGTNTNDLNPINSTIIF